MKYKADDHAFVLFTGNADVQSQQVECCSKCNSATFLLDTHTHTYTRTLSLFLSLSLILSFFFLPPPSSLSTNSLIFWEHIAAQRNKVRFLSFFSQNVSCDVFFVLSFAKQSSVIASRSQFFFNVWRPLFQDFVPHEFLVFRDAYAWVSRSQNAPFGIVWCGGTQNCSKHYYSKVVSHGAFFRLFAGPFCWGHSTKTYIVSLYVKQNFTNHFLKRFPAFLSVTVGIDVRCYKRCNIIQRTVESAGHFNKSVCHFSIFLDPFEYQPAFGSACVIWSISQLAHLELRIDQPLNIFTNVLVWEIF